MQTNDGSLKAVFLDRDGVLNDLVDRGKGNRINGRPIRWTAPFNRRELRIKPNAYDALQLIEQKGYLRILVTNQPDVAEGRIEPAEFAAMMEVVRRLPLDDVFVCTHAADTGCACRKPAPGMIIEACKKHGINSRRSYMVGDNESDIVAGKAVRAKTILVTPYVYATTGANCRVMSLMEAAQIIR